MLQGDVRDKELMDKLFSEENFDAVIHFAGFKAVGESVEKPLEYYDNNIGSSIILLETMRKHNCYNVSSRTYFAVRAATSSLSAYYDHPQQPSWVAEKLKAQWFCPL